MRQAEPITRYVFVASVGFVFALMLNESFDDLEWETLATGFLAVAAALITVSQMRRSDDRQEKRHDALMRLSIRQDVLAAQRAAFGGRKLHQMLSAIPESPAADPLWPGTRSPSQRYAATAEAWLVAVEELLERINASGATALFDGLTTHLNSDVTTAIVSGKDEAQRLKTYCFGSVASPEGFKERVGSVEAKLHFLRFKVELLTSQMRMLGELYTSED